MNDAEHVNHALTDLVNKPVVPDQQLPNGRVPILGHDPSALSK